MYPTIAECSECHHDYDREWDTDEMEERCPDCRAQASHD